MSENASVGIVISTVSGMLRYLVIPDTVQEHDSHGKRIWSGETYLVANLPAVLQPDGSFSLSLTDIEAAITKVTGKPVPAPERGVMLDKQGTVVSVALIDPAIDPGLRKDVAVVLDAQAEVGWSVTATGDLQAPVEATAVSAAPLA